MGQPGVQSKGWTCVGIDDLEEPSAVCEMCETGDIRAAHGLLVNLPAPALCAADTAYDSNGLRIFLISRRTLPVIPNHPTRKHPRPFDEKAYKLRNRIERTIARLKDWRRIHTRYDKLANNFASAVAIAAILIGWT